MTNQEAIKSIKSIIEYWTYRPSEVEAATIAVEALEKQNPKKVIVIPGKSSQASVKYY